MRGDQCSAGYVQLQVDDPRKYVPMSSSIYGLVPAYMKLLEHQNGEQFLFMPTKFRRWIISVLDRSWEKIRQEWAKYGIKKVIFFCQNPFLKKLKILST